jgi:putative NIF3 family GTP cyclohydrolase 1 type 2
MGRIAWLSRRMTVRELALEVKRRLGIETVRVAGDEMGKVKRVALSTGSGGSLVPQFLASDAEAFITGDLRYHEAREIEAAGRGAIDIGHFPDTCSRACWRNSSGAPCDANRPLEEACPLGECLHYL